jgi:hypothetical protein
MQVRAVSQAVMIAWGETMVKGRKGVRKDCVSPREDQGLGVSDSCLGGSEALDEGNAINVQGLDIIAGYPNLGLASVLFKTQEAAERILSQGGLQQGVALELDTRLKGFSP